MRYEFVTLPINRDFYVIRPVGYTSIYKEKVSLDKYIEETGTTGKRFVIGYSGELLEVLIDCDRACMSDEYATRYVMEQNGFDGLDTISMHYDYECDKFAPTTSRILK